MSIGAERVRLAFNPSDNPAVDKIKALTAALIDECCRIQPSNTDGELARLRSLACTAYEEAAMWAVKAATYGK